MLGGILHSWPLKFAIEDLNATARDKRNLLYYLTAEKGQRASRWDMKLCDHREAKWQEEKSRERLEAQEFFGDMDLPVNKVKPEWVISCEQQIVIYEGILTQESLSAADRRMYEGYIEKIKQQFAQHGF